MSESIPFKPHYGTGFAPTVTNVPTTYNIPAGDRSIYIANRGGTTFYFWVGNRPITVRETGMVVRGATFMILSKDPTDTTITVATGIGQGATPAHIITGNCGSF